MYRVMCKNWRTIVSKSSLIAAGTELRKQVGWTKIRESSCKKCTTKEIMDGMGWDGMPPDHLMIPLPSRGIVVSWCAGDVPAPADDASTLDTSTRLNRSYRCSILASSACRRRLIQYQLAANSTTHSNSNKSSFGEVLSMDVFSVGGAGTPPPLAVVSVPIVIGFLFLLLYPSSFLI